MRRRLLQWGLKFLRWAGRIAWMGSLLAFVLRRFGSRLPMEKILETDQLQAFHHPEPEYPLHILIIPKQAIASLTGLEPGKSNLPDELLTMVRDLVDRYDLEESGYRLIVNGGPYQELPQLHFHLVSGSAEE